MDLLLKANDINKKNLALALVEEDRSENLSALHFLCSAGNSRLNSIIREFDGVLAEFPPHAFYETWENTLVLKSEILDFFIKPTNQELTLLLFQKSPLLQKYLELYTTQTDENLPPPHAWNAETIQPILQKFSMPITTETLRRCNCQHLYATVKMSSPESTNSKATSTAATLENFNDSQDNMFFTQMNLLTTQAIGELLNKDAGFTATSMLLYHPLSQRFITKTNYAFDGFNEPFLFHALHNPKLKARFIDFCCNHWRLQKPQDYLERLILPLLPGSPNTNDCFIIDTLLRTLKYPGVFKEKSISVTNTALVILADFYANNPNYATINYMKDYFSSALTYRFKLEFSGIDVTLLDWFAAADKTGCNFLQKLFTIIGDHQGIQAALNNESESAAKSDPDGYMQQIQQPLVFIALNSASHDLWCYLLDHMPMLFLGERFSHLLCAQLSSVKGTLFNHMTSNAAGRIKLLEVYTRFPFVLSAIAETVFFEATSFQARNENKKLNVTTFKNLSQDEVGCYMITLFVKHPTLTQYFSERATSEHAAKNNVNYGAILNDDTPLDNIPRLIDAIVAHENPALNLTYPSQNRFWNQSPVSTTAAPAATAPPPGPI